MENLVDFIHKVIKYNGCQILVQPTYTGKVTVTDTRISPERGIQG